MAISKQFNIMQKWQEEKDRQETAQEVHDKLMLQINETNSILSKLKAVTTEHGTSVDDKINLLQEADKDLDERVTMYHTKLEREEFFDIND